MGNESFNFGVVVVVGGFLVFFNSTAENVNVDFVFAISENVLIHFADWLTDWLTMIFKIILVYLILYRNGNHILFLLVLRVIGPFLAGNVLLVLAVVEFERRVDWRVWDLKEYNCQFNSLI